MYYEKLSQSAFGGLTLKGCAKTDSKFANIAARCRSHYIGKVMWERLPATNDKRHFFWECFYLNAANSVTDLIWTYLAFYILSHAEFGMAGAA